MLGLGKALGHQQHHGGAAGQQVRLVLVALEQVERLLERGRLVVVEGSHGAQPPRAAAWTASTIW